jgi:hypothetical protein
MHSLLLRVKRFARKMRTVDYIILGCVVVIIGSFLLLRLSRKTQWISVVVKIQSDQLWWNSTASPWYAQALSEGQEAFNAFGQKTATISRVQSFETPEGRMEMLTEIQIKASYDVLRRQYEYNYQPLLIGKSLEIPFTTFSFTGMVVGINSHITYVDKTIEARLLAIHVWKITGLAKGLQAKDSAGNIIAEILDINIQNAHVYEITDTYGRRFVVHAEDATRKDVTMKLKIKAIQYNGALYSVYGSPIKIGSPISIQFPRTSLGFVEISAVYD